MAHGKKKHASYRKQLEQRQKAALKEGAGAAALAATGLPVPPEEVDIPWTADKPQPVRRAFGIFRVGKIDFMGKLKWFAIFSGILITLGLVSLIFRGLNYSIDFTGGNSYSLHFQKAVSEIDLRSALEAQGLKSLDIRIDKADPTSAIVRTPYLDTQAEAKVLDGLKAKLGDFQSTSGDAVSPTIGGELVRNALIGTLLACLGILIYVAIRFEYRFGAAGVLALIHDLLITVGIFSLFHLEIDSAFIAALLTIVGYSIMDTIVVFDRIRDNLKRRGKEGLVELSNRSINETFVRSVNTSVTAFLAISAIFFLGGETTKNFALALMCGIFFGTYSSICIATPIWLWWRKRDERILAASGAPKAKAALRARG